LTVRVEQVEFHEFTGHVRFTGVIVEGPFDLGRHHTLDVAEGDDLTVDKESWTAGDEMLLQEGLSARSDPSLVIACVDWGESSVVRVRGRSVEPVADINRTISGKRFKGGQGEKDRRQYVDELVRVLVPEVAKAATLVVAGPGFLKEELARALTEREPSAKGKLRVFPTSESGRVGIDELLRSGRASEALSESAAATEAASVEGLVRALAGGRRAAVGPREVHEAIEAGAVETLLVSEGVLRTPNVVPILDIARAQRTPVLIVRRDGDAGRRLHGLGDVGALLRYDWSPAAGRGRRSADP
jgi:protein pelota